MIQIHHNKLIKCWWFQESSQEEEILQQRQVNKKILGQTLCRWISYTNIMFFILTQNQYAFVSTECKKVPLQYQQYIWNQISLDELKAAKCEPGMIHGAQPSTSNEGNSNTQPSTSKQHPPPAMKPSLTKGNAKPSNKKQINLIRQI